MRRKIGWVTRAALLAAGLLALAVLIDGLCIEPYRLVERTLRLPCSGLRSGPVRMAFFSDVGFLGEGRRERALRASLQRFDPDVVLVGGDLIEQRWATRDARVVAEAGAWLRTLPARSGRFLAPGEEESEVFETLRAAWGGGAIDAGSNESRRLVVRGETLDLFLARPGSEPAPWSAGRDAGAAGAPAGRPFLFMRGRGHDQIITYAGEGSPGWRDVVITFAFQTLDPGSGPDLRFAWKGGGGPWGGDGLRLVATPYHREVWLHSHLHVAHALEGPRGTGFEPPVGVWCRARVELHEDGARTRIRARLWKESDPEPASWQADATDARAERDWHGTIAFAGDSGRCRYADLRVEDGSGAVQLDEPFSDPRRLRGTWEYDSALADWIYGDGATAARILLAHNPDLVLEVADLGGPRPDLVLAGHTHGGQVRIPGYGALYTSTKLGRRYDAGLFPFDGIPLYITAGVGTSTVPVRLFDPPEIVLITLVPASQ